MQIYAENQENKNKVPNKGLWPSKYERHTHIYVYMYVCFVNAGNILFHDTKITTVKRQCCGVIAKTVGKDIKS